MLATLCYTPKLFWGPLPRVIGPHYLFHVCPLWDLAMWRVTSGAVLHGRGDIPGLVLLGGIICASLRCLHALWETWRPLEWFWCYWGQSQRTCSDLLWAHCTTPTWYSCQCSGWLEWAEKVHCHRNKGMSRRGGWSAHVTTPVVRQSVAPLHRNSCSKSSLGAHPCVLLHLRHINNKLATHTLALH